MLLLVAAPAWAACENSGVPGTPYEGYAAAATGGAGRTEFPVTNLNNAGAGSLRQAVADASAAGGGCITFTAGAVAGTITLSGSNIVVSGANITIDGFSAPAPGPRYTIAADPPFNGAALSITGTNIIVRGMRCRGTGGPTDGSDSTRARDCARIINGGSLVVVDHNSFDSASDGAFDIDADPGLLTQTITVSNNIFSNTLKLVLLTQACNVSYYRNLFFSPGAGSRLPLIAGPALCGTLMGDVRNNIMWGWSAYGTAVDSETAGTTGTANLINNYYFADGGDVSKTVFTAVAGSFPGTGQVWAEGNVSADSFNFAAVVTEPGPFSAAAVTTQEACQGAYTTLANAGARTAAWGLDATDAAIVAALPAVLTGCGPAASPSSTVLFQDTFTEAADTSLSSHAPDIGSSWSNIADTCVSQIQVKGGTGVAGAATGIVDCYQLYRANPAPTSRDYDVRLDIATQASNFAAPVYTTCRMADASHFYATEMNTMTGSDPALRLVLVNGTVPGGSVLGSASVAWAPGNMVVMQCRDAAKTVSHCTTSDPATCTPVITSTDNTLTAAGFAGLGMGGIRDATDNVNSVVRVDNFTVTRTGPITASSTSREALRIRVH